MIYEGTTFLLLRFHFIQTILVRWLREKGYDELNVQVAIFFRTTNVNPSDTVTGQNSQ